MLPFHTGAETAARTWGGRVWKCLVSLEAALTAFLIHMTEEASLVQEARLAGLPRHPLCPVCFLSITGVFALKLLALTGQIMKGELYMLSIKGKDGRTILYQCAGVTVTKYPTVGGLNITKFLSHRRMLHIPRSRCGEGWFLLRVRRKSLFLSSSFWWFADNPGCSLTC